MPKDALVGGDPTEIGSRSTVSTFRNPEMKTVYYNLFSESYSLLHKRENDENRKIKSRERIIISRDTRNLVRITIFL